MERTERMRAWLSTGNELRARMHAGLRVSERRLDLAVVSTAVPRGGDGPPVIVPHGIGQFAGAWMRMIPELAATNTVVFPDLPGQVASELMKASSWQRYRTANSPASTFPQARSGSGTTKRRGCVSPEAATARYGWPIHVIDDCGADPNRTTSALVKALQTALRGS